MANSFQIAHGRGLTVYFESGVLVRTPVIFSKGPYRLVFATIWFGIHYVIPQTLLEKVTLMAAVIAKDEWDHRHPRESNGLGLTTLERGALAFLILAIQQIRSCWGRRNIHTYELR